MKKGTEKIQTDLNWVNLYLKNGGYPPGLTAIEKRIVRKRAEQFCFMNDELYFLGTMKSKEIGQGPRKVLLTYEERWDAVNKAHVAQDGKEEFHGMKITLTSHRRCGHYDLHLTSIHVNKKQLILS